MASKNNKNKLKGQRSVLTLLKDREVTKWNSEDNSTIQSEEESTSESATRATDVTPGRKRKERSPQELINPHKKINMGDNIEEKLRLERQLYDEVEEEIKSLSPELAKVTKILLRRNDHKFDAIQSDITSLLKNAELLQKQQDQIESLKKENVVIQLKCDKIELDHAKLKQRLSRIENELLESTAIIHGVHEDKWEEGSTRYNMVVDVLAYTMYGTNHHEQLTAARKILIKKTSRLGKYNPNRGRPISVSFVYNEDCEHLLANKKYLPKGVYADKQYSEDVENTRRILRPVIRKARKGKYRGLCRMERDQVIIEGRRYGLKNLHQLPKDISTFKCTSEETEDSIGFFGELNELSNFHPCTFTVNATTYSSSEQWIQHCKAKYFRDNITMAQVMTAEDALDCKLIARDTVGYDERRWKEVAYQECYNGLFAKFEQNPSLKQVLLQTGEKTIVESSYDRLWGTGIPLNDPACLDKTKWHNPGILGVILMDIRTKLKQGIKSTDSELMDVTSKKQD